jgi:hypothetical protein
MKNTKLTVGQYGPPTKMKVGSGAMESEHPLLTGHTRRVSKVEVMYTGLHDLKASMETTV